MILEIMIEAEKLAWAEMVAATPETRKEKYKRWRAAAEAAYLEAESRLQLERR